MCTECKVTKKSVQPFNHLILCLTSSCLSEIVKDHIFKPADVKVKCLECNCETGQKTSSILTLPEILILQLKRNSFGVINDAPVLFGVYNNTPVEFEENLNMKTNLSEDVVAYELTSVIYHLGGNVDRGHYTVDVKDMNNTESSIWWLLNDRTAAKSKLCNNKSKLVSNGKEYAFVYAKKKQNSNIVPRTEHDRTKYDSHLLALVLISNEEHALAATAQKNHAKEYNKRTSHPTEKTRSIRTNFLTTNAVPEIRQFFSLTESYASMLLSNRSIALSVQDLYDLMTSLKTEGIEANAFLENFCMCSSNDITIDQVKADYLLLTRAKDICDFALDACRSALIIEACVVVLESELVVDL